MFSHVGTEPGEKPNHDWNEIKFVIKKKNNNPARPKNEASLRMGVGWGGKWSQKAGEKK